MKLKDLKEISISLLEISKELDDMWEESLTDEEIKQWDKANKANQKANQNEKEKDLDRIKKALLKHKLSSYDD